ncbi:MAG: hypothetical protein AAFW46_15845, partial [Pseudomonadota bacterium]
DGSRLQRQPAPAFAACEDPATFCGKLISPACLSAYGAGSLPAASGAARSAEVGSTDCSGQFSAYGDCLAEIASRCGGTSAGAPATPSAGGLPTGHQQVAETTAEGRRFAFVLAPDPVSWSAAERHALAMGGRLAVIDGPAKQQAVAAVLSRRPELFNREQYFLSGWYFGPWIGAFQDAAATAPGAGWRWSLDPSSGSAAPLGYANWLPGNPNDFGGPESFAHFFCIDQPTCETWNDTRYDAPVRAYIVETPR